VRFGLGWRAPLGAGILANLDRIDVVELMAEEFVTADAATRRAVRFLATQVPVVVHATSLGLASAEPVKRNALDAIARVVEWVAPLFWSEHLAFVRASGVEIGHLAAPPRNDATLEGLARNVDTARAVIGSAPLLENVASLLEPPLCQYGEAEWLTRVVAECDTDLLLDLHNLHANAVNFGFDARETMSCIPHERVRAVHLAGGHRIERGRILDDHQHAVPDAVFDLLACVTNREATVILERDGNYPAIDVLLAELDRAREIPASSSAPASKRPVARGPADENGGVPLEAFLARIYVDDDALARFLADPVACAIAGGFDAATARRVAAIDPDDLRSAARSFARKRERTLHLS
jgi:uncharacterized protein (UPF0276 family)